MKKLFLAVFLISVVHLGYSQNRPILSKDKDATGNNRLGENNQYSTKSTSNENIKNEDAKIEDYLIISKERDTTIVDTTLTILKEYKFNYLRKDNYGLLPFSNVGQSYNTLVYHFNDTNLMPLFGARARHFNYMEIDDINYYRVPTPLTELYFKTAFEQGQQLDAFFTVNTSEQLNMSIAYKGVRSLGKYQNILTSTGNFRFTTSYNTKNNRYVANAHIVMQDLLNNENGGITDSNVPYFESGDPEFKDRAVLEVNFEDAENILKGKRFHLDHSFKLIQKDSTSSNQLALGHIISFEDKYYEYNQTRQNDYFGEAFQGTNLRDRVTLENFYNQVYAKYENKTLGEATFNVAHNNYNYGYDKVTFISNQYISNRLKGDVVSLGGTYKNTIGAFNVEGNFGLNISGDFDGNYISGKASYNVTKDIGLSAMITHSSKAPNYNYQLYQSVYENYNWQSNFNNTETQQLTFALQSNKIANVSVDLITINDYLYFKKDESLGLVKPFQNDASVNYLKVNLEKEFTLGKFSLMNTMTYQNVKDDNQVFNVPELVTRNTLYYSNHFFKRALFLQTGVTLRYFTSYNMNAYDPLLAEFYVQNDREYGDFPRLDFFINAKVQQARIFLKAEHFNSAWTGYDFYSAPNHPYRDFVVRFGIVWNFFL
ncbi:putative porin [Mangrovimonas cancribranchiae]|uniref:Porin n=1 Tax=Mangrovimonas cancribranchiae TaxID=3080055 RepID=A0AAU6P1W6_9FLAO